MKKRKKVAMIISMMVSAAIAIVGTINLPDKSTFNLILAPILLFGSFSGISWLIISTSVEQ